MSLLHAFPIRQISPNLFDVQEPQLRIVSSGERRDLETQLAQPPDQRPAYEAPPTCDQNAISFTQVQLVGHGWIRSAAQRASCSRKILELCRTSTGKLL